MSAYDVRIAALEVEHAKQAQATVYLGDEASNSISSVGSKRKRVTFTGRSNARTLTDSPDLLALRMGRDWEAKRDYQYQEANRPTMIEYSPAFWVVVGEHRMERVGGWWDLSAPPAIVVSPNEYYGSFHGVETSHTRMVQRALTPNRLADNV